jgi:phosphatidylserine/phosphatidylglycerophosphate/cardiolipin synthase-like enzyme
METETTHKQIRRVASLQDRRALLREVFQTAHSRVLIVSPFISKSALQADGIPARVQRAIRRGVAVQVYIDNDLNREDGDLKRSANDGIVDLIEAGATVTVLDGIHYKTLIRDNDLITEGSFNWLSAVRTAGGTHQREERTIVIEGVEARQMIEDEIMGLNNPSGEEMEVKKVPFRFKKIPKFGKFIFGFLTLMIGYEWHDNGFAGLFFMTIAAILIFGLYYNNFDAEMDEDEIMGSLILYQLFFK